MNRIVLSDAIRTQTLAQETLGASLKVAVFWNPTPLEKGRTTKQPEPN
jgi:hypothetical protein